MDFLGIIKGALGVIGDVTGLDILKNASKAIETIPPEKQAELKAALYQHQQAMAQIGVDEMKLAIAESLAQTASSDKYTSRARPTGVYAATAITTAIGAALCYCLVAGVSVDLGAIGAILSLVTPLWGSAAYYTKNRTDEKVASMKEGT